MCYQASRFEARLSDTGDSILFDDQDRSRWDNGLIDKGHYYLVEACMGNELSKYHLEAAIAYWHATDESSLKWERILALYNELLIVEYSPVAAVNRAFAYAELYGDELGIEDKEAEIDRESVLSCASRTTVHECRPAGGGDTLSPCHRADEITVGTTCI